MVEKKKKKQTNKQTKKISVKRPAEAKPEHYFILVTGVPLKNLKEMANALETMNDWAFNHHVNDSRNDFSNWIKEIMKEDILADEIKNIRNIRDMEIKIMKHLINTYL